MIVSNFAGSSGIVDHLFIWYLSPNYTCLGVFFNR